MIADWKTLFLSGHQIYAQPEDVQRDGDLLGVLRVRVHVLKTPARRHQSVGSDSSQPQGVVLRMLPELSSQHFPRRRFQCQVDGRYVLNLKALFDMLCFMNLNSNDPVCLLIKFRYRQGWPVEQGIHQESSGQGYKGDQHISCDDLWGQET